MIYQDNFYLKKESNAFFKRWQKNNLNNDPFKIRNKKKEIYNFLSKNIDLKGKKVLEIGCFISDLLFFLKKEKKCKIYGIESSSLACKYAKKNYKINIENNTFFKSSKFLMTKKNYQSFDIIICDDVLSWFSRDIILPSLASIDWLLKDNGFIFFRDFSPNYNFAVINHHWKKNKIYNFKNKFGHKTFFLNTGKYKEIKNFVRIDRSYQTVISKNKQSLIWSDCILKKNKRFTFPIVKI